MEILFAVLCFVNGLVLGAAATRSWGRRRDQALSPQDAPQRGRLAAQVENFLNYDGTSRGQQYIDGE